MQNQEDNQSLINTRINTMNIYNDYAVAHNSYNTEVKVQAHSMIHNN